MTGAEILMLGTMFASAGASAFGAIQQGKQQNDEAKFNAAQLERQALLERQVNEVETERFRRAFARKQGSSRANIGGSGVALEGSPLDVLAENAAEAELDVLTMRFNAEESIRQKQLQAAQFRRAGKQAKQAGFVSAAGSILSGAGQAAGFAASGGGGGGGGGGTTGLFGRSGPFGVS